MADEATSSVTPPVVAQEPPTTSGSTLKRNSDEMESSNKRPKVILDDSNSTDETAATTASTTEKNADDTKTVVTPTSASEAATATTKAAAKNDSVTSANTSSDKTETLDIAETLGLKPGSVIEVQWEIQNETNGDENEQQQQQPNQSTATNDETGQGPASEDNSASLHWWKATLLEHDGRTTDSVAIRTLHYEARPDLGFPEPSKEDVVFLGKEVLITSTDSSFANWDTNPDGVNQMPYRRVRNGDERGDGAYADEVFYYNDDQLDEQLNSLLMGAFQKNQAAFNSIPAAQQAVIAETIQKKKEELKEILRSEAKNKVVTAETIKDILARAF